jgi:hypothetical protein
VLLQGLQENVLGAPGLHRRIEVDLLDRGVHRQLIGQLVEEVLLVGEVSAVQLVEEVLDVAVLFLEHLDGIHG